MAINCANDDVDLLALEDLKTELYLGIKQGGLYLNGLNTMPPAHREAGVRIAQSIKPRNSAGIQALDGKIVVAGIGPSGSKKVWNEIPALAREDHAIAKNVKWLNLCRSSVDAVDMSDPGNSYWTTLVPEDIAATNFTAVQVQVLWIMTGAQVAGVFPDRAETIKTAIEGLLTIAKTTFPNAVLAFLCSGNYNGYSVPSVEPERYEMQFAIKWVIETQLNGGLNYHAPWGPVISPHLSWAFSPWTNGIVPRLTDGFTWLCPDDTDDGNHPNTVGAQKIGRRLLHQWKNDPLAEPWIMRIHQKRPK